MLRATSDVSHESSSATSLPAAEWTSPVITPPPTGSKACFMYDVDLHRVSRVTAKLLYVNISNTNIVYSRRLFASTYHTRDNVEIELEDLARYQVR